MRRAARIAAAAHRRAMQATRPGRTSTRSRPSCCTSSAATARRSPPTTPIVAGGANACVLHYVENDAPLRDGELLLIDAGCELDGYASDITRTFPVNGRFSAAQREVYEVVLAAQRAAIATVTPGNDLERPARRRGARARAGLLDLGLLARQRSTQVLEKETYKRFYMHRTGHWLGLDVHDAGDYKRDGEWRALEPGMVLTVEPGLYIRRGRRRAGARCAASACASRTTCSSPQAGCEVLTAEAPKARRGHRGADAGRPRARLSGAAHGLQFRRGTGRLRRGARATRQRASHRAPGCGRAAERIPAHRAVARAAGSSWSGSARGVRLVATPIETVQISQQGSFGRTRLEACETGVPALGYVVDYTALCRGIARARHGAPRARRSRQRPLASIHAEGAAAGGARSATPGRGRRASWSSPSAPRATAYERFSRRAARAAPDRGTLRARLDRAAGAGRDTRRDARAAVPAALAAASWARASGTRSPCRRVPSSRSRCACGRRGLPRAQPTSATPRRRSIRSPGRDSTSDCGMPGSWRRYCATRRTPAHRTCWPATRRADASMRSPRSRHGPARRRYTGAPAARAARTDDVTCWTCCRGRDDFCAPHDLRSFRAAVNCG